MNNEQIYLGAWQRRLGAYVKEAMFEWDRLCIAYGQMGFVGKDGPSLSWFEAGKLDFIKLFSRAKFWEMVCIKNGNWRPCSGKYYKEFLAIYSGWKGFIKALPIESETYELFDYLLHARPPSGYAPHPDSSWAIAERIDWSQLRPISIITDLALKGFEDGAQN